jgi:hypothetical protein
VLTDNHRATTRGSWRDYRCVSWPLHDRDRAQDLVALIENSWQREAKEYLKALEASRISFTKLVSLGRSAEIPYTLFFAPIDVVEAQLKRKQEVLLGGASKGTFSLNSRGTVRLADVELIVKDMMRKQELLKGLDPALPDKAFVGALRRSRRTVKGDAELADHPTRRRSLLPTARQDQRTRL